MLVYTDIFTDDEVISDSYKQCAPFDQPNLSDAAFEVESRRITKGDEDYGISANVDEDAAEGATGENCNDVATVIDIVDKFSLQEYTMTKGDFKAYIKGYMGHLMKKLGAERPDRLAVFKDGVANLVKKVLEEWDTVELYMGTNYMEYAPEHKALPIIGYYKGEETSPRFIFMKDGLREIKC